MDNASLNSRGIRPCNVSGRLSRIAEHGNDRCSQIRRHSLESTLVIDTLPKSVAVAELWAYMVFTPLGCHLTSIVGATGAQVHRRNL